MSIYDEYNKKKNNEHFVKTGNHLDNFLLFQIYSPQVIRIAKSKWKQQSAHTANDKKDPSWYLKGNTPMEIQTLITESETLSNDAIQQKLDSFWINHAIHVLEYYHNIDLPLTDNSTIATTKYDLLSSQGLTVLNDLKNAINQINTSNQDYSQNPTFSNEIVNEAIRASHKFLFDPTYFKSFSFSQQEADELITPVSGHHRFPILQLTKGCSHNCPHCCSCASTSKSHMPWMLFTALYRALNKHYIQRPINSLYDPLFNEFFSDSDLLEYNIADRSDVKYVDPIDVDAGDVAEWVTRTQKTTCFFMTHGVTNEASELALAKAIKFDPTLQISISYVETSLPYMQQNIEKLNKTLDIIEKMGALSSTQIIYTHSPNYTKTQTDVFRELNVIEDTIFAVGRASNLPEAATLPNPPDINSCSAYIIRPSGEICFGALQPKTIGRGLDYIEKIRGNVFSHILQNTR